MPKICPLGGVNANQPIVFENIDISPEDLPGLMDAKYIQLKTGDNSPPSIRPLAGYCAEDDCAWWDEKHQKCAVAVLPLQR